MACLKKKSLYRETVDSELIKIANNIHTTTRGANILDCGGMEQLIRNVYCQPRNGIVKIHSYMRVGKNEILGLNTTYQDSDLKKLEVEERLLRGDPSYNKSDKKLKKAGL